MRFLTADQSNNTTLPRIQHARLVGCCTPHTTGQSGRKPTAEPAVPEFIVQLVIIMTLYT